MILNSEEAKKIILSRLKNYTEYMANLGGSLVVCVGGSNKTENCSSAKQHIVINKLDNYGYYHIFLLLLIHADGKIMVAHGTIAKTIRKRDRS